METANTTPDESIDGKSNLTPAKSKLSIPSLILSISGFVISVSISFLIFFIGVAGGGFDIMLTRGEELTIIVILYVGLFLGIAGGILGAISLSQGGSKAAGIISILFSLPTYCICGVGAMFYLSV